MLFAATISILQSKISARGNLKKLSDGAVRINDHQNDERNAEHDCAGNGDAIKVLLDDAGARLVGIHGACDHFINASTLARVKHDENDETDAGGNQQNEHDNKQKIQFDLLLSILNGLAIHKLYIISIIPIVRKGDKALFGSIDAVSAPPKERWGSADIVRSCLRLSKQAGLLPSFPQEPQGQ